MTAHHL